MTFLSPTELARKEPIPGFVGLFAHGVCNRQPFKTVGDLCRDRLPYGMVANPDSGDDLALFEVGQC